MKCPECGFEGVLDNEKFCGECGANIRTNDSKWDTPKWKWGSLISSIALVFQFWSVIFIDHSHYPSNPDFLIGSALFGFPLMIYLLYKERTQKIKYGFAWITFPLIIWFFMFFFVGDYYKPTILLLVYVVPAFVIDIWYIRKLYEVGK